jgi:hypothetical protein
LNVRFRNSSGGTEEILSQDRRSPYRDLNPGPPEFEAEMVNIRLRSSFSESYSRLAVQGISHILCNAKIYCRV